MSPEISSQVILTYTPDFSGVRSGTICHHISPPSASTARVSCKQSQLNIPETAGSFSPPDQMNYHRRLWSDGKPGPGSSDRDLVIWKQISVFTGRTKTWISTQGQRRAFWLKDEMDLIETFAGWLLTNVLCVEIYLIYSIWRLLLCLDLGTDQSML